MTETLDNLIPAISDSVFKTIFSARENRKLISYLISYITKIDYLYIYKNFKYGNTELLKKRYDEKGKVTDLLIYLKDEIINIEMNKYVSKGIITKNNIYHHNIASSSIKKGENYNKTKKSIQINLNYKKSKIKKLLHKSKMQDNEGLIITDDNYETYHVNMELAMKKWYSNIKLTRFEKILVMMQLRKKEDIMKIAKGDEMLMIFGKSIEGANEEIGVYDKEAADEFVRQIDMEDAKEKGIKLGVRRGKMQGIEQGKKQGLAQKAKEIALNMLKANMDIADVSKLTGLKQKEIIKLSSNL